MAELHHSVNLAEINPFREVYNGTRKTRTPELICRADVAPRSVGWLWSLREATLRVSLFDRAVRWPTSKVWNSTSVKRVSGCRFLCVGAQ